MVSSCRTAALSQTAKFLPNGASWNRTGGATFIDQLGGASTTERARLRAPAGLGIQINLAATMSSGTGAPAIQGALGDLYIRTDTPSTANQRIYVCTTAGAAGAAVWTGIS